MSEFNNYFNYFTEIEEHFQRVRGTSLFLLSPLDWALIETWKTSGIPLVAVQRGIDTAFEKWRTRRIKSQTVNSLAFCSQAVLTEAQRVPGSETEAQASEPFPEAAVSEFIQTNLQTLQNAVGFEKIARALALILEQPRQNLEELEQRLTVLEERMVAVARTTEKEEDALADRRELEQQLQPYRRKMSAPQLDMLERQFLERRLIERCNLPRLSLFYLR